MPDGLDVGKINRDIQKAKPIGVYPTTYNYKTEQDINTNNKTNIQ